MHVACCRLELYPRKFDFRSTQALNEFEVSYISHSVYILETN